MSINVIKALNSVKHLALIYLSLVTVVSIAFALIEGKDLLTGYWWAFVTGLTIGYGDVYPVTIAGKILTVVWAHFMVFLFAPVAVGHVVLNMLQNKNEFTDIEQKELMRMVRKIAKEEKNV